MTYFENMLFHMTRIRVVNRWAELCAKLKCGQVKICSLLFSNKWFEWKSQ